MAAVLLDVDGTLVDTNYFHVVSWYQAFREAGETVPMWRIHRLVGMGADKLLEELAGGERPDIEKGWSRHYDEYKEHVSVLPGARDLVRALHERGLRVALVTSGQEDDVAHLRELLDVEEWIDTVVNSSEVDASKPAPDIFRLALERLGADAAETIAVGDTVWDVKAANASGIRCVAVRSGGIGPLELWESGAVAVYRDAADLLDQLGRSPLATVLGV
jgi:HAD superfamily hydrolase (TIGR01509 family)